MRLAFLLVAAIATAAPAAAQEPVSAATPKGQPATESTSEELSISLDRIREGLRKAESQRALRSLSLKPDFTVSIEEQDRINRLMSKIEVPKPLPAPGGGWYGYQQQQMLFNPVDHPLEQPYAAFSAGQFFTIGLENLFGRYGGKKLIDAVQAANRARAQSQARTEVERNIAEFCASRSDRDFIQLCAPQIP